MSTVLKLKQSSLNSFFLPDRTGIPTATITTTSNSATATTTSAAAAAASDYEQLRQENIRRNQDFFQKLGITASLNHLLPLTPKPKPNPKPKPSRTSALPLRRSTRKRRPPSPLQEEEHEELQQGNTTDTTDANVPYYGDSSVLKYTCFECAHDLKTHLLESPFAPIAGFRIVGKPLLDPALTRIYAIDVCHPRTRENRVLLAAGGHGGYISVYGSSLGFNDDGDEEIGGPLMGWKSSRSWVSGVGFTSKNPMLLVSSSNDGGVVVWDISKQPLSTSTSRSPPVVVESNDLHSDGVFSMDLFDEFVATASKDSSVGICRLTMEGGLVVQSRMSGHHLGAIRGVSFRDLYTLADCGADRTICVLDTRVPQPCTLTVDSEHATGVNMIQWCPSKEFLLLSASKDPTLLLYDIRKSAEPLHKLVGHVKSNAGTCYQIYKPAFVDNGTAVATPGQGSKSISLYSVETGKAISQGLIGYDANMVLNSSGYFGGNNQRVWVAGKQIYQLCPIQ